MNRTAVHTSIIMRYRKRSLQRTSTDYEIGRAVSESGLSGECFTVIIAVFTTIDHRQHRKRASHSCCIVCSVACSGPGAQRYGEMDERMSRNQGRNRLYLYSESGLMAPYIPHTQCSSQTEPLSGTSRSLAKGHTLKGVISTS